MDELDSGQAILVYSTAPSEMLIFKASLNSDLIQCDYRNYSPHLLRFCVYRFAQRFHSLAVCVCDDISLECYTAHAVPHHTSIYYSYCYISQFLYHPQLMIALGLEDDFLD